MTRVLMAFLVAVGLSGGAWAETCTFTTECYEAEGCEETNFTMEVQRDKLITDAETIPVGTGGSDTVNVFVGYTASAFHVLTREVDGQARYVTHLFDGPVMVSYLGACQS